MFDKIIEKEFYTETEAAHVFKQFMLGINYCHSQGIVHRDLKPENFLYETKEDSSDVKIIDFGLSKIFKPGAKNGMSKMTTKAGTVSLIFMKIYLFIFSLTTFHQRYLQETTMKSVTYGPLDAFCTLFFVVTRPSVEMTIKRFSSSSSRESMTSMEKNGKMFQRKLKTLLRK